MPPGGRERWVSRTGWLLAISYGVGAPLTAVIEYRGHAISQRFDIPVELVYATSLLQFGCALAVLVRPIASLAAAALTATTLGAIGLHLKSGSPMTAWPAVLFTAIQTWFGLACRHRRAQRE